MDKVKKIKKDEWVRMASRSHQGRFYLFNKATGETQWLPSKDKEDTGVKKGDSPPKISLNTVSKTPAQDRLKRLQHTLKANQAKPHTMRPSAALKVKKPMEQENELNDGPSTSCKRKSLPKSPKKETKRSYPASLSNEANFQIKRFKYSAVNNSTVFPVQDAETAVVSTSANNKSVISETCTEISNSAKELITSANSQNITETKSSKLSDFSFSIVKKIKEICKMPFSTSKKLDDEKLEPAVEKPSSTIKTTMFKATSKAKVKKCVPTLAKKEAIVNQINEETAKPPENNSLVLSTPKKHFPSYPRGSANSRLERLKQSLLSQQQSHKSTNCSDISSEVPKKSTETNNNIKSSLQEDQCHKSGNNSLDNTANSSKNDEVEAMDWQPIDKEEKPSEEKSFEPTLVVEKSKKLMLSKTNENGTMGDIIDTVNENLLRFSAEKQKDSIDNNKWRKKYYYFIVDTNVLLRDLTFVDDLTKMKLCDTKGSILYIPYSVLQELDKLKMRSGFQEGVKTLAVRAIKYLNSKFENNSPHVQAQSALDERHHLIDINSADDSIMNCCLQAKQHVPNLLLLTEDVNLRNKAICNNVMVSTKSDLVAKRYDS